MRLRTKWAPRLGDGLRKSDILLFFFRMSVCVMCSSNVGVRDVLGYVGGLCGRVPCWVACGRFHARVLYVGASAGSEAR